jgi:hypothetical protein
MTIRQMSTVVVTTTTTTTMMMLLLLLLHLYEVVTIASGRCHRCCAWVTWMM